jgi:hypothetical protein
MKRSHVFTAFTDAATVQSVTYNTENSCGFTAVFKVVIATVGAVTVNTFVSQDNSTFVLYGTSDVSATGNVALDVPCRNYKYVRVTTSAITDAVTSCSVSIAAKGTETPGLPWSGTALAARTTAGSTTYKTDNAVDMQIAWTNTKTGGGGSTVKNVISVSNDGTEFATLETATVTTTLNRTTNIDLASKPYAYVKVANVDVTTVTTTATVKITSHVER